MWDFLYEDTDKIGSTVLGTAAFLAVLWQLRVSSRAFLRGLSLACFVSSGPILMFAHEFFGTSSVFTAAFLGGTTLALLLLGNWKSLSVHTADLAFCVFLAGTTVSIALHGFSDSKELALLALTVAAYPAGRVFAGAPIEPTFTIISATIVVIGAITILAAINAGPGYVDSVGKVFVFGKYGAAQLYFAVALAVTIAALVARSLTLKQAVGVAVAAALPTAIIAAAMVRFSFVSIMGLLAVAAIFSSAKDRKALAVVAGVLVLAIMAGHFSRPITAALFMKSGVDSLGLGNAEITSPPLPAAALQAAAPAQPPAMPAQSRCAGVDQTNTIEIRKQLYREAFQLLPQTMLIGVGLDRFMHASCLVEKNEVHNSVLQVAVEFGWPASIAFLIVALLAGQSALSRAPSSQEARFALCVLTFLFCMSMAHGRISRDAQLFLFLGYAVSASRQIVSRASTFPEDVLHTEADRAHI
ncbi:O-antigen ligase family protein [Bradyrhizobium sp. 151]|uniref:O-antigen ligase family protein n=1 Tax=Bradyrhizobium sp. 151 TaxID=2782626 RepID=UPI001FF7C1AB|nr:O-antigen ligase family protein [Bradyrhizobium sp. 151]MCK1660584.1 O-antigen ligase family protein [Bradyrhizobium sp. 151]